MRTIRDILISAAGLEDVSDSARLDVEILLCDALKKERAFLYTWPEKKLTREQLDTFANNFLRRQKGEPIAYIVGYKEFWSLQLKCNSSTLIPRPETELLVESALRVFGEEGKNEEKRVLDLGTGTGAIALAIASERPRWKITAVDSEQDAVLLAIENCRSLGLTNIEITKSNWFDNLVNQHFDLIVSNPPYIDEEDAHLSQGDVRFEPKSALTSSDNGLSDIKKIIVESKAHLHPNGWLLLEHGYNQAPMVRKILADNQFALIESIDDLAGHERVTVGTLDDF